MLRPQGLRYRRTIGCRRGGPGWLLHRSAVGKVRHRARAKVVCAGFRRLRLEAGPDSHIPGGFADWRAHGPAIARFRKEITLPDPLLPDISCARNRVNPVFSGARPGAILCRLANWFFGNTSALQQMEDGHKV